MDYEDGTVFDDFSACQINMHPLMSIKCYTTTAGRGINISMNQQTEKQAINHRKEDLCVMKTSAIAADQSNKIYFNEPNNLADQIQRASGMSYSNQSIERNFSGPSSGKESQNQFEDMDERSASNNSDLLRDAPLPNTFDTTSTLCQSSKPIVGTSPTKRKTGRREFRKLDIHSLDTDSVGVNGRPTEKKLSDVFKPSQSFNPAALMSGKREDRLQLGSKNEFPAL